MGWQCTGATGCLALNTLQQVGSILSISILMPEFEMEMVVSTAVLYGRYNHYEVAEYWRKGASYWVPPLAMHGVAMYTVQVLLVAWLLILCSIVFRLHGNQY